MKCVKSIVVLGLSALNGTEAFAPATSRLSVRHGISSQLPMTNERTESPHDAHALTSRRGALSTFLATTAATLLTSSQADAAESRTIARLQGSGLVFKDTLVVGESFSLPKNTSIHALVGCNPTNILIPNAASPV